MRSQSWITTLSLISLLLAISVIMLGAYTRLKDAGLGCPDWPGCYGSLTAPSTPDEITQANQAYPTMPVEVSKARTEMTHRYFAETLGGLIIVLALATLIKRRSLPQPSWLAIALVGLVLFQGLLGMWTVTMRLLPLAVMSHLLGGFATLSLLWLYWLYSRGQLAIKKSTTNISPKLIALSLLTLLALVGQISLGGWTSANYAALICPDFPTCQGQWWPATNFKQAFNVLGGIGMENPLNYMDGIDRTTIHLTHRIGALIILTFGSLLTLRLWQLRDWKFQRLAIFLALLLTCQLCLGIANVILHLPLGIAVAHNCVAALLLLTLITIQFTLFQASKVP